MSGCWVILASGYARRYGADKTLARCPRCQTPMIGHVRMRVSGSGLPVAVVLRPEQSRLRAWVQDAGLVPLLNPHAGEGMAAAIRHAVQWAEGCDWLGVLLADLPGIRPETLRAVMHHASAGHVVRPIDHTLSTPRPGHPVIFGRRYFRQLAALSGDEGARRLMRSLSAQAYVPVPVRDSGIWQDVDQPKDWARVPVCPVESNVRQNRR